MESSSSSVVAEMDTSSPGDHGQATQITSIDGFFNRKRGRPPKNRFVEVYKSAQHSPQAIFTSFKLEKSDHSGHSGAPVPSGSGSTVDSTADRLPLADHDGSATDLTPSRNRKRGRVWAPSSSSFALEQSNRKSFPLTARSETLSRSSRNESLAQPTLQPPETLETVSSKNLSSRALDKVSVVRAAGTFYPENANSAGQQEVPEAGASSRQETADLEEDQPEDLSMRPSLPEANATAAEVAPALNMNLLQFKQLIELYQRQVLLPTFLAAASQPLATGLPLVGSASGSGGAVTGPLLDMRLLLENAAHLRQFDLNAAVAARAKTVAASTADFGHRTPVKRVRDHDIPTGYLKFRFNEDCGFERCGYRNHQSHFHCNRRDCHYSFCDKTRFVQHTARHERMDTLMGDDFRQFRANMQCGVASCSYAASTGAATESSPQNRIDPTEAGTAASRKTSHFHCRKCDYVCTDSNKVVAHRRLHLRQDYVRSAGFRKVGGNEPCDSPGCSYAQRHTHYHCDTCDGGVLSRAQLAAHKHRTAFPKPDAVTTP